MAEAAVLNIRKILWGKWQGIKPRVDETEKSFTDRLQDARSKYYGALEIHASNARRPTQPGVRKFHRGVGTSKYQPHQGVREKARRVAHAAA